MCLAIPLKLMQIEDVGTVGTVELTGGGTMTVGLDLVPGVSAGEYVLVHAGMAIEALTAAEAAPILEAVSEYVDTPDLMEPGAAR
jgi:hydrogenase expression/formation protein HypC